MKRKIILHIGAGKTGTSSIQKYLASKKGELLNNKILIPSDNLSIEGKVTGQHVWYFNSLRDYTVEKAKWKLESDILNLIQNIESEFETIILSAENLSDRFHWKDLFVDLNKQFEIELIFYIRRQDEYLNSAWQQWYVKHDNDFWAWMTRVVGHLGNWKLIVEEWMKVIPKEQIKIRRFEREKLEQSDVIFDFCTLLDLPFEVYADAVDQPKHNTSFNLGVLKIAEENSHLFANVHDNEFYNFISRMSPNSHKKKKHSAISHKQRLAILSRYHSCNDWIQKNYFSEEVGKNQLFKVPKEGDYIPLNDAEIEKLKWNVLVEGLFGVYKNSKNGRKA